MKLPLIAQDKANHFIYGCIICFLSGLVFNPINSILITFLIALSKEIYDKLSKKGTPEILDIIYTIIGGLIIFLTKIIQ